MTGTGRHAALLLAWRAGAALTFIWLTFLDGYRYTAWNWLVAVPANAFLSAVWPIYWIILRPLLQ